MYCLVLSECIYRHQNHHRQYSIFHSKTSPGLKEAGPHRFVFHLHRQPKRIPTMHHLHSTHFLHFLLPGKAVVYTMHLVENLYRSDFCNKSISSNGHCILPDIQTISNGEFSGICVYIIQWYSQSLWC